MKKLLIAVLLVLAPNLAFAATVTENWNDLSNWNQAQGDATTYSLNADDGLMLSRYIRALPAGAVPYSGATSHALLIQSKFYFEPGTPASYSFKTRYSNAYWLGIFILNSEAQYYGSRNHENDCTNWTVNLGSSPGTYYSASGIASIKITWDGVQTFALYVNDVLKSTRTSVYMTALPMRLWLGAIPNAGGYIDVGQITATGVTDTQAYVGDNAFIAQWSTASGFSDEEGAEQGDVASGFLNHAGGLTARYSSGGYINNPNNTASKKDTAGACSYPTTTTYATGTWDAESPAFTPPTGRMYKTLTLAGNARSGSISNIKTYLRYSSDTTLVPDSLVAGNSTGLAFSNSGTAYDVSKITEPFYADVEGSNSTTTSPAVLQALWVDYQDSPVFRKRAGGGNAAFGGSRNVGGGNAGAGGTRHINGGGA